MDVSDEDDVIARIDSIVHAAFEPGSASLQNGVAKVAPAPVYAAEPVDATSGKYG
ncbi:hypothetical protein GCM10007920_30800 [Ciceribacter naphthalenivorans]|uniref:Uncharacterized protein n=2 Tax=Alphaproteobacteria TaxID=28211 RepID=A0A512HNE3_9HYPH|nr:hypothetical protein RNA01_38810 [Ciceribacter naphthalenivorans]GLR23291.1 hypothetical protein GCM10007920_30800 [Ciceribacter naphthalenivorans]GLT06147.1 hypothetical protein GCM10007926_30800 [Sphingomonas psychrolutea]